MKVIGIIPARFASTRLPGKPLALIGAKPMLQHVFERASQARTLDEIIIATDDERIFSAANAFPATVMMTSADHATGSDRIAEVAASHPADILVNIQGDEPFIDPRAIDAAVEDLINHSQAVVGTLITPIKETRTLINVNTAKVIIDKQGCAIYFSRTPIPFNRDMGSVQNWLSAEIYYQHIGMYVFRKEFLMKFVELPQSTLEKSEKLEQLRILENGYKIKCTKVEHATFCVDTPEDLEQARQMWKEQQVAN